MCVKGLNLGRATGASTEDASTEDALSSPHAFCSPRKAFLSAPLRFVLFIRPGKVSEMKRNYICYMFLWLFPCTAGARTCSSARLLPRKR